jgi:hypothetical protein
MSEKSRVVAHLNLKDIHLGGVAKQGVAEFYFNWKDFDSGHSQLPSAALFIANSINSGTAPANIEGVIDKFIRAGHKDDPAEEEQKASVWLHIRITQPNKKFDEPRWHQDGPYMKFDPGRELDMRYKYCLTMLGPGTIFAKQTPELADYTATAEFREERSQVAKQLSAYDKYQSNAGEVVRCTWKRARDDTSSDVHTEPPHNEDRIFLAVVFMSNEELDDLTANRK